MDALKVALNGVILNILVVLGLVGNICAIIVLTKPRMKSSLNYLVIGKFLDNELRL